jgi:hypothetical protein
LNLRPPGPQPGALPDCATPRGLLGFYASRRAPGGEERGLYVRAACEHVFVPEEMPPQASSDLRRCGRCKRLKPLDEFAWRRKARGQLDNYCRPCRADYHHEHYVANRAAYIENALQRKRNLGEQRTKYLIDYFQANPCTDCGERDPVVLESDHIRDKSFNIGANLRYRNWQALLDEIAKCEVVCANCHRRRTAHRLGSVRAIMTTRDAADQGGSTAD